MIDVSQDGGLWRVTLNRPDKANSLTLGMLSAVAAAADAARGKARAFVLTGTGDRVFSAGADLDEAKAGLATDPVWEDVSGAIARLDCLSICALNGTLAGGAFGMALACDLRITVPEARFFYPVAKLGFLPQPSDPGRMIALMGPARTKMILLAGAKLTAEEALNHGLVDRIVPREGLMAAVDALVADSLAGDPTVLRGIKAACT